MIKKFLPQKEAKYITVSLNNNFKENSVDDRFLIYCKGCKNHVFKKDIEDNTHNKFKARDRIRLSTDKDSFNEFLFDYKIQDPLNFPKYIDKLNTYKDKILEEEAVICGVGGINKIKSVLCVMNPDFMMGSMGSIVGDKITYSIEYAAKNYLPIIMQEGILSLMQMAKTSQALSKLEDKSLPYISILTDPTTGGVTASFAMLGDIIMSEPNTLIGFAGPRVIEQTINQKLPEGFQTSEFLLEHGFIDIIVNRYEMKDILYKILSLH